MTEPITVDERNGEVVVTLPKDAAYAALALRIDAPSEEETHHKLLAVSNAVSAIAENDEAIHILYGVEALAALDFASRRWAETLDVEAGRWEPNLDELGDHLRRSSAMRAGIGQGTLLDWGQLKDSEREQWLGHARAAADFLGVS